VYVDVRTVLPTQAVASAWYVKNLPIEIAPGTRVALKSIARIHYQSVNPYIRHFMRERVVLVSAYVDPAQNNAAQIKKSLQQAALPHILSDLPGVRWDEGG